METKTFTERLNEVYLQAVESLTPIINEHAPIQIECGMQFCALFYSSCNGAVFYDIAKIVDFGTLLCVEECQRWDKDTIIDEEESGGITLTAIMGLNDMDKKSLCEFADFLNELVGNEKTDYLNRYMKVYQDAKERLSKKGTRFYTFDYDLKDVTYIDDNCDIAYAKPIEFKEEYFVKKCGDFGEDISYDIIPTDDFCLMVDDLINKGVLK